MKSEKLEFRMRIQQLNENSEKKLCNKLNQSELILILNAFYGIFVAVRIKKTYAPK